jgi:D-3-phosphoglycerate dehydrogenase
VLEVWRTSCPRLPVWEEANERGFLDHRVDARKTYVVVSERGNEFLALSRGAAPRAVASTREGASITPAAAESWLQRYGEAWRRRSPDLAAALFAEDCRYFETPFDEPAIGRQGVWDYWQAVPEGQTDIDFEARVIGVFAQTVVAHWTAAFTRIASGTKVELDGVFMLEFNDEGLCSALREWWHRRETAPDV